MCRAKKDNWSTLAVNVQGKYNAKEQWKDSDGKPLRRTPATTWAATPEFFGQHCSDCVKKIFAISAIPPASLPAGRWRIVIMNPITPKPKISTRCMASGPKTPPSRPASARNIRIHAVSHEPLDSSNCMTIW